MPATIEDIRARLSRIQGVAVDDHVELDFALALLETARVIVMVLDPAARIVFVNRYFEQLSGYDGRELEGRNWFDIFVTEEDQPPVQQRFDAAMTGNATAGHVNPIRTRNGERRIIEWYDRTFRDARGAPTALLVIGHDITAKQQALDEVRSLAADLEARVAERSRDLATSNQILEGTFQAPPLLVAYLDPNFDFVRVNDAYAAAGGRRPEDFVGKNHFDLFPHAENEAIFRDVLRTGRAHSVAAKPFTYAHAPQRGMTHWDWTLTPIKDDQERVAGLVLTLFDVTERIRALERAALSEARFRQLVESSPDLIAIVDRGRVVRYLNHEPPCADGPARAEVVGGPVEALFESAGHAAAAAAIERVFASATPTSFEATSACGRFWHRARVVPFPPGEHGRPKVLVVIADVTEEHRAAEQRETMLAELDHRVKNTLATVIAIAAQTLARTDSLPAFRETFVGRLGSLARAHEALAASRWTGMNLEQVLRTVVEPLTDRPCRLEPGSADVALPPTIVTPLALALHELATNALKHGALSVSDGRLLVRSRVVPPSTLALDWEEHGGPPPRESKRRGLGLTLVRGLVERELGGTLSLTAPPEGPRRCRIEVPLPRGEP